MFSTLKIETMCSSETSDFTRLTWRHIPEDGILYRKDVWNFATGNIPYILREMES
jgi:hypothetical protein